MRVYKDRDSDLELLANRQIAVIGYGNQGRAQALNLRDSGLDVVIGNREDEYTAQALLDGFTVLPIAQATERSDIVMMLIPDEVMPQVFEQEISPYLVKGNALVFASGYAITFDLIAPPAGVDVVLVAPRMIGSGVRDLFQAGQGYPAFIGIEQDYSGRAKALALALAKGIGATRMGVVEVTFAQETELDLFTEQCFGPAFGQVLTTAVNLLLEKGYPPEAILLELYMSGEFAYTLGKIAQMGLIEQTALHSRTSQYGSMSRGMRFIFPELYARMEEGLEEIHSGDFAREWAAEQAVGAPSLAILKETARSLPLYQLERELRQALGSPARFQPTVKDLPVPVVAVRSEGAGLIRRGLARLRQVRHHLTGKRSARPAVEPSAKTLDETEMGQILRAFLTSVQDDPALQEFAQDRHLAVRYQLSDMGLGFTMRFHDGTVTGNLDTPASAEAPSSDVQLTMKADLLDGMLTGRANAMRAAMTGRLSFSGDTRQALAQQQIQDDLIRLYSQARQTIVAGV